MFYSDQAQFPEDAAAATETKHRRHSVQIKFKEFIRNFEREKNIFPYRESLIENPKFLLVHLEDLLAFDADLPSLLRSSPADYLPLVLPRFSFFSFASNSHFIIHLKLFNYNFYHYVTLILQAKMITNVRNLCGFVIFFLGFLV